MTMPISSPKDLRAGPRQGMLGRPLFEPMVALGPTSIKPSRGVRFDNGDGAFPISKVYKQLEGGEFDSVLSFYKVLPKLRTHLKTQTPSQ